MITECGFKNKLKGYFSQSQRIYNYGSLCRETSRFVNLRGKLFSPRACPRENNPQRVDKSGCFPTQRAVIVLLYFCQCWPPNIFFYCVVSCFLLVLGWYIYIFFRQNTIEVLVIFFFIVLFLVFFTCLGLIYILQKKTQLKYWQLVLID